MMKCPDFISPCNPDAASEYLNKPKAFESHIKYMDLCSEDDERLKSINFYDYDQQIDENQKRITAFEQAILKA